MRRIVQPIAFCVLLVFGALPVASLTCEWTCASKLTHASHHHHTPDASTSAIERSATGSPVFAGASPSCDHTGFVTVAVTPTAGKSDGVVMIDVELLALWALQPHADASPSIATSTHSPPGLRPALVSLRI